ncbi:DUF881 domain-containing protein [Nigerium massiliense]|uniref:DUF881 domain-containing protein n=1 Tax=Nigerium massiliense TaxID=1522317 RepID=UPI00058B3DDF|nr:DUF881 domain-containing protein [Nigerium massiliense]
MPSRAPRQLSARRVLRDLRRPTRSHLLVAVVLFLCALLVTLQVQSRATADPYANLRRADLVAMLDDLTAQSRRLENEVTDLEAARAQLRSGADRGEVARREAERRLTSLEIMAGTVPAHGPGVRLTINAPHGKLTPELLLGAINELRDAGAEVIELNDKVRVVAQTWVATSPDGLVADGQTLAEPVVLEAIGNRTTLEEAVRFRGGLISQVEGSRVGGTVRTEVLDDVQVDSLHTAAPAQFSRPG